MKLENWSPCHDSSDSKYCWKHDRLDIEANIYKYRDGETYELDNGHVRDFVWVAEIIEEEIGDRENNVYLFKDHGNNVEELHDRVTEFLGEHPFHQKTHVMDDIDGVSLLVSSIYSGSPFVEPDGRMPEKERRFMDGVTVQGATGTLGYPDWGILNSIDDCTVEKGFHATHTDVNNDRFVIVGADRDDVEAIKEVMESLDEKEMDEDEYVDRADYDMLRENADAREVTIARSGRYEQAKVHDAYHKKIVEVDGTAYVSEEIN